MFGWKQDLFVMFFYSKLEVLGGEISPCFVPQKMSLVQKIIMRKNLPQTHHTPREKKVEITMRSKLAN